MASEMSALGHKRTLELVSVMSALPRKADIRWSVRDVRFVPKADIEVFQQTKTPGRNPGVSLSS
jgi:hypothetical protein